MKRSPLTPSLYAPDLPATIRFYIEKLGFAQTGSYKENDGSEIRAEVTRGEARIWFFSHALDNVPQTVFSGLLYIFIDDVDEFATT